MVYFLYIIAAALTVILIYGHIDSGKTDIFLSLITCFLILIGFILYIIWLVNLNTKYKKILGYLSGITLLLTIIGIAVLIYVSDWKKQLTAGLLSGYTFVIFVGSLIAYFTKK